MKSVGRLSKQLLYDSNSRLHFISSQTVSVTKNSVDYFDNDNHDGTLWIENVESLLYRGYDIARCLEDKSPFKSDISSLQSLPSHATKYSENFPGTTLSLGGRISIVRQSHCKVSPIKDMKLRFCVLENSDKFSLRAVLHEEPMKCSEVASRLGLASYTESDISGTFNGITGIAWSPIPPPSHHPSSDTSHKDSSPDNHLDITTSTSSSAQPDSPGEVGTLPSLEEIPTDTIQYIAQLTEGQASSEENVWRMLRKKRITASMFGMVLKAIDGGKYPDYLFNNLLNKYDLSHVAAIKWGTENEDNAKLAYERVTGVKVQSSGLWLHSSGILGASPDGLLPDGRGLVEFKCPYSLRDRKIEDAIGTESRFYIKRKDDGTIYLDPKNPYYHQIQGMLYIIGREYCDLCVWSPVSDPYILRVEKDPSWERSLSKLITFYFKQFLPRITGNSDQDCLYGEYLEMVRNVDQIMEESKKKREDRKKKRGEVKEEGALYDSSVVLDLPPISQEDIVKIAALTSSPIEHSNSKLWYRIREHRLTSSSFHLVLSAIKRDSYPASLFKSVMEEYYMDNTNIAKLTHTNTVKAIRRYETDHHVTVLPGGLWLDESGILGASVAALLPDGQGIVDVRCLYKYKNISDIGEIVALNDPNFYLEESNSGDLTVKKSHRVHHKIQGALYFSGRSYCDTITWTQNICHVTRVHRNPEWEDNLRALRRFYVDKLFPKLCDKWGFDHVMNDLKILSVKSGPVS
ncbi:hypothetical protein ACHWQZ_G012232 [Mnemiopsis leidyi]